VAGRIRGGGVDAAAGEVDGTVGGEEVVGCCAGDGAAMGDGGTGSDEGAGVDRLSKAGGGVARACLGRRGSPSCVLMTRGRNGTRSHMVACRHSCMLWPGCEQNKHLRI